MCKLFLDEKRKIKQWVVQTFVVMHIVQRYAARTRLCQLELFLAIRC